MKVLALDLDVTKCGVALPDGTLLTLTAPTRRKNETAEYHRGRRLHWWLAELDLLCHFYKPQILAIEALIPSPGWEGTARKAEVIACVRIRAWRYNAEIVDTIFPNTLKKWATGRGDASKDNMVAAAIARGATPANDDEADAALLRFMVLEQMAERNEVAG